MSDTPPNLPNAKTLFYLIDKCITIGVLAIVSWALWSYVEKTNAQRDEDIKRREAQRDEEIKELRISISECLQNKQDRIEIKVNDVQEGIQELLRRGRR